MTDGFVVVWAVAESQLGDEGGWLMVKHIERGWELPGGIIHEGEEPDVAALRELFEETGILGVARAIDYEIIEGGCVVFIEVAETPVPESWQSTDDSIDEVGWCLQIPDNTAWGAHEIERLRTHDWSASITLRS
ncbi:MAG: NUDIX domain-containing protein [Candidatus Thermoplasmatota archaeon]|nr:NUDIX domain-containing protein [Candidatus Thermoplasmatota archaeon]